jgi:hypothetical protein
MVDIALIEQWVSIAAGIATVIVIFLLWQTVKEMHETSRLSRVQLDLRFRPWVGPSSGIEFMRTTPEGKQQFVITLKNYGQAPAPNVVAMFTMKNEMPTRDTLQNSDGIDKFSLGPLLPYMEKRYWFFIDSDTIQKTKEGNAQVFVSLYFAYEFSGTKSGYGMISHFNKDTNTFVHKDMWVD